MGKIERIFRSKNSKKIRRHRKRKNSFRRLTICCLLVGVFLLAFGVALGVKKTFYLNQNQKSSNNKINTEDESRTEEAGSASIQLFGDSSIKIKLGEKFIDPGYEALDEDGTDLTAQVQVDTSALKRAGIQKVVYKIKGNNGIETEAFREVEVLANTEYEASGLSICMYHYVYDPADPPADLNSNYISTDMLEQQLKYLHDNGYYFPTWKEVRDYVDGKLLLPEKSIVLTFDDGPNYMYLGTPLLERYQTPATSFVIASYWDSKEMLYGYSSDYLIFESHSFNMHRGGGKIGHGGIYTVMSKDEVMQDLNKSFEICGNRDAFAYPFGDYTEEGCSTLEEMGLLCAVTTENAKCFPGDNPYLLPRVRVQGEQTLDAFSHLIE